MAVKPPRLPGLHVTFVLFVYWTYLCTSLGLKEDPRNQFHRHAVIQPTIFTETMHEKDLHSLKVQHEEKLIVSFLAYKKQFTIDLWMNLMLLPSYYFEKHHVNGGHVIHSPLKENPSHCHYQGQIRGFNSTLVALSTCNGLSGIINDGKDIYYIQPDYESNNSSHFLFRASDLKLQNLTCGASDSSKFLMKSNIPKILKRSKRSTILQDFYKSNAKSRYVELIIVNDNKEYKEFKNDKNAVFQRSKEIANIVNGLYSPLNIYIALVGVIVWSDHDEIKLSSDGDATLTNFLHYRKERLAQEHPNDNAQLITAMTFDGGVVGKALKGPICTFEFSGGVNMDHSHVVGLVATTMAHELGHNFGMEHDTDECQCPDGKCIMAPSSSSTSPRHWSSCSLEYLDLAYLRGMDDCLQNYPTDIIGPVCGNGFLEKDEECDCGLKEFCSNPCCNATSCQLFSNATCAIGGCCDTESCQLKTIATLCRDTVSECDLPEYCDGISKFCPADTFVQNGVECGEKRAYCYNGQCQSHLDQCKLLWGQTGKLSDLRCFEQNYKGTVNGNCGYNRLNQTYKACNKEDIMCGMMHCTHLNERLEFGMESAAILAKSDINVRGKTFFCRSAIVDLGLFNRDPGLAPNGAKCSDGKACVNQKCVPVTLLQTKECINACNGNGVCNSNGNCHCDKGYAPPYCISYGSGGSIDSGPASDPSNYFIVMAMYILFLGLLPLMLFSIATIYYYRSHIKTWWSKKAHKASIKSRTKIASQRKPLPSSKFNFDRNSLRTLEISAPIQIPPPASSGTRNKNRYEHPNACPAIESSMAKTSEIINNDSNKFVPIRPAPPRPDSIPQRKTTWESPVTCSTVAWTSSLRTPCDNGNICRPLSSTSFRPNCPPPKPPLSKSESLLKQENSSYTYEDITKSVGECERSGTPNSAYYDDCQTLDFSDTPLAFVHKPVKNNAKDINNCEVSYKSNDTYSVQPGCPVNKFNNRTSYLKSLMSTSSNMASHVHETRENSVALLTQKFEKQEIIPSKHLIQNAPIKPPFISRPLPPRPGDTQV